MSAENILLQLLGCGSSDLLPEFNENKWLEIIELAGKQHVIPYLYYHLKEIGALGLIPAESKDVLLQSFKQSTFRNMAIIAEFRRIADAFHKKGIKVIGLKGIHLVGDIYPHIGLRYLRDLDVLIPTKQIEDAYICTLALGYKCDKVITKQDFSAYHHHIHQQFHPDKNIILELHGYLIEDKNIDIDELWNNARVYDAHNYMYLDIEDLMLHLCMHISYSDLFKIDLRHYLDIYMIFKNSGDKINWDQFLIRAKKRELVHGTLLVMQITSELFGCKIPDEFQGIVKDEPNQAELIEYGINFMWQYDKRSKEYEQYRSKVFLSDEPILRRFFRRIFISKEELSFYYSLDPDSPKLYLCYFRRVYDLLKRHFINMLKIKTDPKQIDVIAKTKILHAYLFKNKD